MPDSKPSETATQYRLRKSDEWRQFEIRLFWERSKTFWTIFSLSFTGFGVAMSQRQFLIGFTVAAFGWIASLAWTLANRGSKFWYEHWEHELDDAECESEMRLYTPPLRIEDIGTPTLRDRWLSARRFSVSGLLIGLSDYIFLLWSSASMYALASVLTYDNSTRVDGAVAVALAVGTVFLGWCLFRGTIRPVRDPIEEYD